VPLLARSLVRTAVEPDPYRRDYRHKQERYPGQHEAIVPRELWEEVQQRLRSNAARGRQSATNAIASPLAGKILDADGEPLYAQGAVKAGRRYRYYVSRSLVNLNPKINQAARWSVIRS
jgi:hypothetical protein